MTRRESVDARIDQRTVQALEASTQAIEGVAEVLGLMLTELRTIREIVQSAAQEGG